MTEVMPDPQKAVDQLLQLKGKLFFEGRDEEAADCVEAITVIDELTRKLVCREALHA